MKYIVGDDLISRLCIGVMRSGLLIGQPSKEEARQGNIKGSKQKGSLDARP